MTENQKIPSNELISVGLEDLGVLVVEGVYGSCLIIQILGHKFVMTDVTGLVFGRTIADVARRLISGELVPPIMVEDAPPSSTLN